MYRLIIALILAAAPASAQPELTLPIDCILGETCYIQQFTDRDPSPDATDFTCGPLSYDDHRGTDFALPTLADQHAGVRVLAAAAGLVRSVRDEMPDILQGMPGAPDVSDRDCGNGLVLDHGDGWETQYCHMALGSVLVAAGDKVEQGQPIGLVGLSGRSEFPHVHLSVRHNGAVIDPFDPGGALVCGAPPATTLWANPPAYQPGGIIDAGLASSVPDYADVRAGLPPPTLSRADPLVLWVYLFGGQSGDIVRMTIHHADGTEIYADDVVLDRRQAVLFRAGGRRAPPGGWASGDYISAAALIRDATVLSEIALVDTVP